MSTPKLLKRLKQLETKVYVRNFLPQWCFSLENDTLFPIIKHFTYGDGLDLDRADKKELMSIRGIGEKRAEEIIRVRSVQHG